MPDCHNEKQIHTVLIKLNQHNLILKIKKCHT